MMRRRLLRVGQTAVYIHLATAFFALYWTLLGQWKLLLVSMLSICLHEAGHALVSSGWGTPPAEMEITPLGVLMRLDDEMELSPGKRLTVLLAGPAMSLLLCWTAIGLTKAGAISTETGRLFFSCNLLFVLLNLLPALPLDGGRILSLLLSLRLKKDTVRRIMLVSGNILGLCLIALNVWSSLHDGGWNLSMSIAGCFLMYAASTGTTSAVLAELRSLMDRKIRLEKQGYMDCQWTAICANVPIRQAIECLSPRRYTVFLLLEPGSLRVLGHAQETDVIAAYWNDASQTCRTLIRTEKPCAD